MHQNVDCKSCHSTLVFKTGTTSECVSCHTDVHAMTVGNDCARCHTPDTWLVDAIPELHEQNGFPLIGAHGNLSCVDCHKSDNTLAFQREGNDCINCHQSDYAATQHPNHVTSGFSTDCAECHDPFGQGWSTTVVDHDFFPLTLGHDIQDCGQCHTTGNFADASPECVSCHLPDFNATVNPVHTTSGFSTDCASCHTTDPGWSPATFEHDAQYFPIYSGTHNGQWNSCVECHPNPNNYALFTCTNCHTDPQTSNDHNGMSGYVYESTACLSCHPNGEAGAFDHNTTAFPLVGSHVGVDCIQCHANGYAGTPTNCDACHMTDYNGTTDPNHVTGGFPTDCALCHDETGWGNANFDHNNTDFPLMGSHVGVNCIECHANGYTGTPTACNACHMDDFNGTTQPNHTTAQFPTDCALCHDETAWGNGTFDHNTTDFPLVGSHVGVNCIECHANGYTGTPTECSACHMADYNATTNPNHSSAQFPTDCALCHTEAAWQPSTFDHDDQYFPIYSGTHNGEWNTCADCHTNAGNYAVFTCINCHEHDNQTQVNDDHSDVSGYSYNSNACFNCHPNGN